MSQLTLQLQPLDEIEIKPYRWTTLQEQKEFIEFLDAMDLQEYHHKLGECAKKWKKFRCSNDHTHSKKLVYESCGLRGICPRCSMAYASKRAEIMYQWIKRNIADKLFYTFDLKMNQIVLTLPEDLHSDIENKTFVKMIKSFIKKCGIEAWGYVIQNWHSSNPLGEKFIHAHILSLNIRQDGKRLVQNDYYFDVEKMRADWKESIKKETGFEIEGEVNVHTEYRSVLDQKDEVKHLLEYVYRYPVTDLFKAQVRNKTVNYVQPLQIEKKFCVSCYEHIPIEDTERLSHCRYLRHDIQDAWDRTTSNNIVQIDLASKISEMVSSKPRLVWCGLLTSAKRDLLQSLLDIGDSLWQNLKDIEIDLEVRSHNCRDCKHPLEKRPYDRGEYIGDNEPIW